MPEVYTIRLLAGPDAFSTRPVRSVAYAQDKDRGGLDPRPEKILNLLIYTIKTRILEHMGEYKFQSLLVYQLSLDYLDQVYDLQQILPDSERFNSTSQFGREATSITLNIAEGSTGQSYKEQARFLGLGVRS